MWKDKRMGIEVADRKGSQGVALHTQRGGCTVGWYGVGVG